MNILVTGCGGDIGQSIGKLLSSYARCNKLIGCDIHYNHPGQFIYDIVDILPRCDSENYLFELESIVKKYEVDIVIPIAEAELRMFMEQRISHVCGKLLILANFEAMEVGFDKYRTNEFLQKHGLPYPKSTLLNDVDDFNDMMLAKPFILKGRAGAGGSSLAIIHDKTDYQYYSKKMEDCFAQELIDGQEYTCGLYGSKNGEYRSVIIKRELSNKNGGYTLFGEIDKNSDIEDLLYELADKLKLIGSINVQLRLSADGVPYIFEINPRFSSTVLFRHMLGFNDVIWSIADKLNLEPDDFSGVDPGTKFYKGYKEYIVN